MTAIRFALLATAALPLAACATTGNVETASAQPAAAMPATASAQSPHDRLFALFAAADEASLKLNPLAAISRGDLRYANRLTDALTPEYTAALKANAESNLAALEAIDRASLSVTIPTATRATPSACGTLKVSPSTVTPSSTTVTSSMLTMIE